MLLAAGQRSVWCVCGPPLTRPADATYHDLSAAVGLSEAWAPVTAWVQPASAPPADALGFWRNGVLVIPVAEPLTPRAVAAALARAVAEWGAGLVVFESAPFWDEVAARLAVYTASACRLGAERVDTPAGGALPSAVAPDFGGQAYARFPLPGLTPACTISPGQLPSTERIPAGLAALGLPADVQAQFAADARLTLIDRQPVRAEERSVTGSAIVLAGGRGLGGAEGFRLLFRLANLLGAAVGATRVAVDQGWVPRDRQIGQSGHNVAPDVYVAFGISGASQHLTGIKHARMIVAVNTDPGAPIFRLAHVRVVADALALLPMMIRELEVRNGTGGRAGHGLTLSEIGG